ncbi:MAG: UMP kinase [Anaerolineae bacterium]|jgi:uridylate kinase|nr:UMP kinase [Anaerolineae bacterium]
MSVPKYKRVLLKIGGEAFAGPGGMGIVPQLAEEVATKVRAVRHLGVQVVIVLGAGNFWRGKDGIAHGMDRTTADHIGMLATVMNSLALRDAFERLGMEARVQTAIEIRSVAEPYIRLRAIRHLEKGRVVIIGAGTGNPYFTTDTAGALRAAETNCDILIKATKVDGVYSADPRKDEGAQRYEFMTYLEALNQQVGVMDSTALTLCMDNNLPILVLNLWQPNSLERAVLGEKIGTMIASGR